MSALVHEALSLDSLKKQLFWDDDFEGDSIKSHWVAGGDGSATVVDGEAGGIVRLSTTATDLELIEFDWGNISSLLVTKNVSYEVRVRLNHLTSVDHYIYLRSDASAYFRWRFSVLDTNWMIYARDAGTSTEEDTGITPDTDFHLFRIDCHTHGGSHAHFYIDNVETANSPISTNIPDDSVDYLRPYLLIQTRQNSIKTMDVDYVAVRQDR
jgi:hypothetical protein